VAEALAEVRVQIHRSPQHTLVLLDRGIVERFYDSAIERSCK
jgi:hypothetical protein